MEKAETEHAPRDAWPVSHTGALLPEQVRAELQAAVKWALTREENAAVTIQKLAYRISPDSELATRARAYASVLKYCVGRVRSQLPRDRSSASETSTQDVLSETVIRSLSSEKAAAVLVRFLLQHAETVSDTVMFAAERLNSRFMHRLWRKVDKERAKLVPWLQTEERLLFGKLVETSNNDEAMRMETTNPEQQNAAPSSPVKDAPACRDPRRIHYHPPQVVIWM